MAEQNDFIDLSPEKGGSRGKKTTVFQETEWKTILDNPGKLTKEGVEKKIELWKQSANKHQQILYETMLQRCKTLAPSGKTTAGLVIFSRYDDGEPRWVDAPLKTMHKESETKTKKVS